MLCHVSHAIHCVRGRDPIYRVCGVRMDNTLVTQQPPACPDMLTFFASGVINRVRFTSIARVQALQMTQRTKMSRTSNNLLI